MSQESTLKLRGVCVILKYRLQNKQNLNKLEKLDIFPKQMCITISVPKFT